MPEKEPVAERNLDRYGAPPISWTTVRELLEEGLTQAPGTGGPARHTFWLATVHPDGRPHVMPVGMLFVDGACTSMPAQARVRRRTSRTIHTVPSRLPRTRSTSSWRVKP